MAETNEQSPPARGRRRRSRPRSRKGANRVVPLYKRSASHFQRGDRQRGREYFQEGRVSLEIEGSRARALVDGSERYAYGVGIDWSGVQQRVLHAFCECQRFAKGRPCKHLWATLLALAETDDQPPGTDRLAMRKDRANSWQDLDLHPSQHAGAPRPAKGRPAKGRPAKGRNNARGAAGTWRGQLASLRAAIGQGDDDPHSGPARQARPGQAGRGQARPDRAQPDARDSDPGIRFLVNTAASPSAGGLVLDLFGRKPVAGGKLGKLKPASVHPHELGRLLAPEGDSETPPPLIAALPPSRPARGRRGGPTKVPPARVRRLWLPRPLLEPVLPRLCAEGLVGWWDGRALDKPRPLAWDAGPPWHLALHLELVARGAARLTAAFERDGERASLNAPLLILPAERNGATAGAGGADHAAGADGSGAAGGEGEAGDGAAGDGARDAGSNGAGAALLVFAERIARLETAGDGELPWIDLMRDAGEILIPREDLEEALTALLELPDLPRLVAPEELRLDEVRSPAKPRLLLEPDKLSILPNPPLLANLSFVYGPLEVGAGDPRAAIVDWQERRFLRRDTKREHRALVRLLEAGAQPITSGGQGHELELDPRNLPIVVEPLLADGWEIEAHGTTLRPASPPSLRVESGIDWFELSGSMDFGGDPVEMARVLEAIGRGERFIDLEDGSKGLLPESWVETYGSLAQLAHDTTDEGLRFLPSQALLVDALLSAMPPANVDAAFAELREKLKSFERIKPMKELKSFGGTLRGYQRHGLGWLSFLREFGLGGVLADDMGLGKTVQVLALLQANRTPAKSTGLPSLVVAPRSLVYNWIDEASRFTPKLKVAEYHGTDREALKEELGDYDLVVTTYGTMRRDVAFLATVEFDTLVLDEAQAIKNPASQTARASLLLTGRHRLALTGTPIENHLGELGSIFEFLNPGLLGRLPKLEVLASGRNASRQELVTIAQGIRPFILRRTKAQVLPDLPPKTEQVLSFSLLPRQRELYDQLRAGYQSLLKQVEAQGVGGSAIQVLEALLRLRQVACHPGLVNEEWDDAGSAKLESLFEQVAEVLEEGHKILIFSQFTKLLAYVRRHLDEQQTPYAYLDGQTRKRAEAVERFQTDPECNLFLVSLKAGGFGLNLTAAGYVFLLDPWWNPAVEAQAIDRAHRIGQTQPVFAYRMIAQDTVEEKILELQKSKRKLADTILDGEGTTLSDLTADDLRMLLS